MVEVPRFDPARFSGRGAVGLFVPGAGRLASREDALRRLGGLRVPLRPAEVTIYISLPRAGTHSNTEREPIAIVGGGYHGLLVSGSTRVPGLVAIADIPATVKALETGRAPPIRSRAEADAPAKLARLDLRLARLPDERTGATPILAGAVLILAIIAFLSRSAWLVRVGLLAAPSVIASSLLLSALGVTTPWLVTLLLCVMTLGGSAGLGFFPRLLVPAMVAFVVLYLVVLVHWPVVNSLSAIGPHPETGSRFYGLTNQTSGALLTMTMFAGGLLGRALWPFAALVLLTDGWSRAGADGGGILMFAAAFLALWLRLRGRRLTWQVVAGGVAAVVALGLALVGIDAATGGHSHVTKAVEKGPGYLFGELGHRIRDSALTVGATWHTALVFAVSLVGLVWIATRPPRFPAGDALLVGIAVSLVVNDTPPDVLAAGAVSYSILWAWARVGGRPRSRLPADEAPLASRA